MPKFIELPSGDAIIVESIRAIRNGDPRPAGPESYQCELKPRVIIDFVVGDHGNSIIINCESVEDRNALAESLKAQLR